MVYIKIFLKLLKSRVCIILMLQWIGWHKTLVTSCDMHSESFLAISGCDNGTLIYWDTRSGKDTQRIEGKSSTMDQVNFTILLTKFICKVQI